MSLKERYDAKLGEIRNLEATIAELEEAGAPVPYGIRCDVLRARAEADELRLWGHREHTRQMQEARERAAERDMLGRVRAEWERIDAMPVLSPEEMRRKREELGVRQQDLALAAAVVASTVNRAENGGNCEPMTLKNIAAGLEWLAESRAG
jgi:DNA-binding XRE family transcriptional regulator